MHITALVKEDDIDLPLPIGLSVQDIVSVSCADYLGTTMGWPYAGKPESILYAHVVSGNTTI